MCHNTLPDQSDTAQAKALLAPVGFAGTVCTAAPPLPFVMSLWYRLSLSLPVLLSCLLLFPSLPHGASTDLACIGEVWALVSDFRCLRHTGHSSRCPWLLPLSLESSLVVGHLQSWSLCGRTGTLPHPHLLRNGYFYLKSTRN